jgi:hypothetical protein
MEMIVLTAVSTAEALAKLGVENGRAPCYISNRVLISVICFQLRGIRQARTYGYSEH